MKIKYEALVVDKDGKAWRIRDIQDPLNILLPGGFVADEDCLHHWTTLKEVTIKRVEEK